MPKVIFDGIEYELPDHHDGDREWLISMLYSIKTRAYEPGPPLIDAQRKARINAYSADFNAIINQFTVDGETHHSAQSIARRAANTNLRQRIDAIGAMRSNRVSSIDSLIVGAGHD